MTKKGQGLPLNVIIIAAIVLIVLVVLWAIFAGRMGKFSGGLNLEDLKSEAAAENIGKTTCQGTCFKTVGTDAQGKLQIFKVWGHHHTGDSCISTWKPLVGQFTDVKEGEHCCITKDPHSNEC